MDEQLFTCKDCGGHELIVTHSWSIQDGDIQENWQEWGYLDDIHQVEFEEKELLETVALDLLYNEFYVNCEGCEREIPFGWSHPDRGGRIWPVECTDYNPMLAWPEERYKDNL